MSNSHKLIADRLITNLTSRTVPRRVIREPPDRDASLAQDYKYHYHRIVGNIKGTSWNGDRNDQTLLALALVLVLVLVLVFCLKWMFDLHIIHNHLRPCLAWPQQFTEGPQSTKTHYNVHCTSQSCGARPDPFEGDQMVLAIVIPSTYSSPITV